ncbi:hypothetical protein GGQ86_004830 [Xanthobacter flavus]|uniref:Uncharacterized protein n=1 Tax=Xanthobacter flavus TaxID=281 RepID=A0ABU1KNZ7_XANFL|nr:hypothetical protein [Xanthobacter flavus]
MQLTPPTYNSLFAGYKDPTWVVSQQPVIPELLPDQLLTRESNGKDF